MIDENDTIEMDRKLGLHPDQQGKPEFEREDWQKWTEPDPNDPSDPREPGDPLDKMTRVGINAIDDSDDVGKLRKALLTAREYAAVGREAEGLEQLSAACRT